MDTNDSKPSDFAQPTVHADWKGRPSPGPRGDSGPDDVNAQGHPEDAPESKKAPDDRERP